MRKSNDFVLKTVAGNIVLVPVGDKVVDFNGILTVNETAKFIWDNVEGDFDSDSITELLCANYEVDEPTARKSADKFIDMLKGVGAIE